MHATFSNGGIIEYWFDFGLPIDTLNGLIMFLFGLSGIAWAVVYVVAIYRGFKDKAPGMPLFALVLNIGWEFVMSFIWIDQLIPITLWIFRLWVALDVVLLIQEYLYGYNDFKNFWPGASRSAHIIVVTVAIIGGFLFTYMAVPIWNDWKNGMMAAAVMNVSMSYLYLILLNDRKSTLGQSLYIAWAKFIGTDVLALAVWGVLTNQQTMLGVNANPLVTVMGVACFCFDLLYIIRLGQQYKKEGLSLRTRKPIEKK